MLVAAPARMPRLSGHQDGCRVFRERFAGWRDPCLSPCVRESEPILMSRLVHLCTMSFHGLFPMLGALLAARSDEACIAKAIPGIGTCRSTYCKAERRVASR